MELTQELGMKQKISQETIQYMGILQMGTQELKEYLQEVMLENPVVEMEEIHRESRREETERKLQWLEAGDYQNQVYYRQEREQREELTTETEQNLTDYLLEQLLYMDLEKEQADILSYMIQCLDENGYFKEDWEETADALGITVENLKECKELLCSMEPSGVGAGNLRECLMIQLEKKEASELPKRIVQEFLEEFGRNQLGKIARCTGKSLSKVTEACQMIKSLNPRPSNCFSSRPFKNYLIPDLVIVKLKEHFEILVNDSENPKILVSSYYREMLQKDNSRETRDYIQQKIHQAEWVQRCVEQRNSMLLALGEKILQRQIRFFQMGKGHMQPMTQKELAAELGISPSAISRAVKGKYLQCTWGTYPLSYFFSVGVEENLSKDKIQYYIRELIQGEDKKKPFSDRLLTEKLQEMGIPISRRTVAKYRDHMEIPDALGRKEF